MNLIKMILIPLALCITACGVSGSDGTDEPDSNNSTPACSSFDEATCGQQTGCIPITGKKYDESEMCLNAEMFIVCWEEDDTVCGDTIAAAIEASDGVCWFQDSLCKPASWPQATDDKGVCADAYSSTLDCP